jgi:hypothetical protein
LLNNFAVLGKYSGNFDEAESVTSARWPSLKAAWAQGTRKSPRSITTGRAGARTGDYEKGETAGSPGG